LRRAVVYAICVATLNEIAVLLLRPLMVTSVRQECENAELGISYKQYILHTLSKMAMFLPVMKIQSPFIVNLYSLLLSFLNEDFDLC
jgi:hypothetical protein